MATQGGGSPFNDFISNFMMLNQVVAQRKEIAQRQEQIELSKKMGMIQGYGQYIDLLRSNPDPEAMTGLQSAFEQMGFDPDTLLQTRESVVPATQVSKDKAVSTGIENMTPDVLAATQAAAASTALTGQTPFAMQTDKFLGQTLNANGPMGEAMRTRLATGQTPGGLAEDRVMSGMSDQFFKDKAAVEAGLVLSASQVAQMELGWGNLRQDERLGIAQLALQEKGMLLDNERLSKASKSTSLMPVVEQYGAAIRSLSDTRAAQKPGELEAKVGLVNSLAQQLTDAGVLPAQWYVAQQPDGSTIRYDGSKYSPEYARQQGWRAIAPMLTTDDVAKKSISDWIQR